MQGGFKNHGQYRLSTDDGGWLRTCSSLEYDALFGLRKDPLGAGETAQQFRGPEFSS